MDQESQKILNAILAKEDRELTDNDRDVLRSRASYIGRRSRSRFPSVFGPEAEQPKEEKKTEDQAPQSTENPPFAPQDQDDGEDE